MDSLRMIHENPTLLASPRFNKVIGISGKTGAGKTTLSKKLAHDLNATLVSWDDFDDISIGPPDYVDWYHKGQDYNAWDYQSLAIILQSLKMHQPILHPVYQTLLQPTKYIIFDAPLGRLHYQTGKYIDRCIHLEVPLDVLLCRRLLRDFKDNHKTKEDLFEEMKYYLLNTDHYFLMII